MADKIIELYKVLEERRKVKRKLLEDEIIDYVKVFKNEYGDGPEAGMRISEEMRQLSRDTRALFMLLMFKAHSIGKLEKYEPRINKAEELFKQMDDNWFEMSKVICSIMRDFIDEDHETK